MGKENKALVSFLGSGKYGLTTYYYNGEELQTDYVPFFLKKLIKPGKIVVIGTEESSWEEYPNKYFGLHGYKKIIVPYGRNEEEFWRIFQIIIEDLRQEIKDYEVHFDLTHGFRSLPLFALTVLNLLSTLENIKIGGIYYGMYQKDVEKTPIINLNQFLYLNSLVSAYSHFSRFGDAYDIALQIQNFRNNLPSEEKKELNFLSKISKLLESLSNAYSANAFEVYYDKLNAIKNLINDNYERLSDPKLAGFRIILKNIKELAEKSISEVKSDYEKCLYLARKYAKNRRFSQAAEMLREGFISWILYMCGGNIKDRSLREKIFEGLYRKNATADRIRDLRNRVAHGFVQYSADEVENLVKDLDEKIEKLIKEVEESFRKGDSSICKILNEIIGGRGWKK